VLGERKVVFADLERLPYARAVLDETLRLYPPAWLITRKALDADVLGGHDIPAGALIILSPWLLHRHPQVWADPQVFRPERFIDGEVDRNAFIPFGAGPRLCIGRDFSYVEGVAMLASLAHRYRFAYPEGTGVPLADPLVTIRPVGGLPLVVTRR
jgi:cytochrome P450